MHRFFPFAVMVSVFLMALGSLRFFRWQASRRRPPRLTSPKPERIPGHTLLKRLDTLNREIVIQAAGTLAWPVAVYAGYVSTLCFGRRPFDPVEAAAAAGLVIMLVIVTSLRLHRLSRERLGLRLGFEGKIVVGQALNRLMAQGYRVYHDVPAEGGNIDHVLVGEKGVFAVATRTRAGRAADRQEQGTVTYDSRVLHFPDETETDIIGEAKRQSKWLAERLSQVVGEPITVRAVVALPGWLVRRTSSEGLPVVNPRQFESLFQHIPPRPLAPAALDRIAHELDQKCRDAETSC